MDKDAVEKKEGIYKVLFGGALKVLGLLALLIALIMLVKIAFGV